MGIGRKRSEYIPPQPIWRQLINQSESLFSNYNKQQAGNTDQTEGPAGAQEEVLDLKMTDEELVKLAGQWEQKFNAYYGEKVKPKQEENLKYWRGEQFGGDSGEYRVVDNVIFSSIETLLPVIAREDPTPLVLTDNTDEGIEVSEKTARMLSYISSQDKLKVKIKQAIRNWAIYMLGCLKVQWDYKTDSIKVVVVRPENLILDPDGTFDGGEFTGGHIGEYKTDTAETLVAKFPKAEDYIMAACGGNLGTPMRYQEWWTDEYVFWKMGGKILDKNKNPNWNYGFVEQYVDKFGVEGERQQRGANHFNQPKKPYSFLWFFNLGKHPFDETSLIQQTKTLQDLLNKRTRQIDKNADDTNNGWVFSNVFSMDAANRALASLRKGGGIVVPTPTINDAVQRFQAPALPAYIVQEVGDKRMEIADIMGVRGLSPQGAKSEDTVRGKIMVNSQDMSRIAPIVEQVEQMVSYVFNYMVQLMYVYFDEPHVAAYLGNEKAMEYMELKNTDMNRQMVVMVKEGSMIPQDPLMRRNEAVDLYAAGSIDLVTELERLDFPNPRETAEKAIMQRMDPQGYMQQLMGGQPGQAPGMAPQPPGAPQMAPAQQPAPAAPPGIPLTAAAPNLPPL